MQVAPTSNSAAATPAPQQPGSKFLKFFMIAVALFVLLLILVMGFGYIAGLPLPHMGAEGSNLLFSDSLPGRTNRDYLSKLTLQRSESLECYAIKLTGKVLL